MIAALHRAIKHLRRAARADRTHDDGSPVGWFELARFIRKARRWRRQHGR